MTLDPNFWWVILFLALGTYAIRFSFLGLIGNRPMPPLVLKLLRYTPVAVLPGMVAPLVLWPSATGGEPDPARLIAAFVTILAGVVFRSVLGAMALGAASCYGALWATGQLAL